MSYSKTKKNKTNKAVKKQVAKKTPARKGAELQPVPVLEDWDEVRKLPVMMIHTAGGPPLMGHVQIGTAGIRFYAPAQVVMPNERNVLFQPFPFIRRAVDIMWPAVRAKNIDIDDLILRGYVGFFEAFIKDAYAMRPVVMSAGYEAPEPPVAPPPDDVVERFSMAHCPACNLEVSNWAAHYPVLIDESKREEDADSVFLGEALTDTALWDAGVPTVKWVCEIVHQDIRERYLDYTPPKPLSTEKASVQ